MHGRANEHARVGAGGASSAAAVPHSKLRAPAMLAGAPLGLSSRISRGPSCGTTSARARPPSSCRSGEPSRTGRPWRSGNTTGASSCFRADRDRVRQRARRARDRLHPRRRYQSAVRPQRLPGTISVPEAAFEAILEYAARSFKLHGFKDIVFLGGSRWLPGQRKDRGEQTQPGMGLIECARVCGDAILRGGASRFRPDS